MARIECYRCPITIRTTSIQPYDLPRFVSDIVAQLHEIGHWSSRCCAVINQTASPATASVIASNIASKESRVPSTILSEMDLIKKNLNVVEKQQNTRLMSEIAYLQCALRSEAEEKMTDFERYVESKIGQCVEEHTKRLNQQQLETTLTIASMQDSWRALQMDVMNLSQQLNKVQTTMESHANRATATITDVHSQFIESAKAIEKNELALGNQLANTKLHLQEMQAGFKTNHDQLNARFEIVRNEVKYSLDQLKSQLQQHARVMNRFARGSNLFDLSSPNSKQEPQPLKTKTPTLTCRPTSAPKTRRPISAKPVPQTAHIQPVLSGNQFLQKHTLLHENESGFDVKGKICPISNPEGLLFHGDADGEVLQEMLDTNSGRNDENINVPTTKSDVPPCYVMDQSKYRANPPSSSRLTVQATTLQKSNEIQGVEASSANITNSIHTTSSTSNLKKGKPTPADFKDYTKKRQPQRPGSAKPRPS